MLHASALRSPGFLHRHTDANLVGGDGCDGNGQVEDVDHKLTFLRLPGSDRYSDLALHEHADVAAAYPPNQVRMAHIGWEIDDPAHLVTAFDFLTARTRVVLAADFGVARSVMGFDPDGHVIEFELFTPGATGEPGFAPLDIDALRAVAVA